MNPVISEMKFFLKTVNDFQLITIVTKNSVLNIVWMLALSMCSWQKFFTLLRFKNFPFPPFLPYFMLALVKPEYPLLTNNKQSIHFDDCIKKLRSEDWNAQDSIYLIFPMKIKIGIDHAFHVWLIDKFGNYRNLLTLQYIRL